MVFYDLMKKKHGNFGEFKLVITTSVTTNSQKFPGCCFSGHAIIKMQRTIYVFVKYVIFLKMT